MSAFQSHTGQTLTATFHQFRADSPLLLKENPGSQEEISVVSFPYFLSFQSFFLSCIYFPFFSSSYFSFLPVCLWNWGGVFVAAWPAWLRWLAPLARLLPLRPPRSVPRPVRCGWGIKPSALCTFARRAGPRCPTPTTLWTTARPSKTAGPPNPPVCLVSCLSPCLAPR